MMPPTLFQDLQKEAALFPAAVFKALQRLSAHPDPQVGATPADVVYSQDAMTLLRYRPMVDETAIHPVPVLLVYALINRHILLDLEPGRSFVQNMLQSGIDVYLIDWGRPTAADRYLDMGDYLNGYLDDALECIRNRTGTGGINLMGVCMGGTLSVIYTALHPEKVKNLITLATPTQFDVDGAVLFSWAKRMDPDKIVAVHGNLPGDLANILYLLAVPVDTVNKYVQFFENIENPKFLDTFLRMEKWIFDSPDMAGEVFRQYIGDLLQKNLLIQNRFVLDGQHVDLRNIRCPLLNVYGKSDYLAPPGSSIPLGKAVGSTDATTLGVDSGHVGIFVGSMSSRTIIPKITSWIKSR